MRGRQCAEHASAPHPSPLPAEAGAGLRRPECPLAVMLVVLAVIFALAVLPQMWVRRVIAAHGAERADFPGTGGEFARHILDEMKLGHVKVEETDAGDHYDPEAKAIRLLPKHFGGRSLAAVVIAAHEAGHAMQDASGYPPLQARTRLAKQAIRAEKVGRGRDAGGAHRHGAGQGAAHPDHRGVRRRDDLRAVDPAARRHAAGGVRRQLPPRAAGAARPAATSTTRTCRRPGRSCAPPPSPTWRPPP